MKKSAGLFWCLFGLSFVAKCDNIASPVNPQNIGPSPGPFFLTTNGGPSVRYQQVYDGADFSRILNGPVLINEISFSLGQGSAGPVDARLPDLQIDFSTTSKSPDLLSSKFAENIGADDTVVYSGALRLTNNFLETYGMHIFLQHPFLYDPRAGNLLLDVRNYQTLPPLPPTPPGQAWLMAASATFGDSTSLAAANDVNSDTAVLNSGGLLTVFNVTVVPEPSPALIWGLSFAAVLGWRALLRNARTWKTRHR